MILRALHEALVFGVVGLVAALFAQRYPRLRDWFTSRTHLPSKVFQPHALLLTGALAGATRALLHGGLLALRGEELAPFDVPTLVPYLAIGGALFGSFRRGGRHARRGALPAGLRWAFAGAALGWLPVAYSTYDRQIASAATAFAVAGLLAFGYLRLRRAEPVVRRLAGTRFARVGLDRIGTLVIASLVGTLLATVLVPAGIAAPPALLIALAPLAAFKTVGMTRWGGQALDQVRPLLNSLRSGFANWTEGRGRTPALVGGAAGVAAVPALFFTGLAGFLVEDGLGESDAASLNAWAFFGLTAGTVLVAPLARRWNQGLLVARLTLIAAGAMWILASATGLWALRIVIFTAAFTALAPVVALPPLLAGSADRPRTSGVFARSAILTIAFILTVEPPLAAWIGWRAVAMVQSALMVLAVPVLLLLRPFTEAAERDRRRPSEVWGATFGMLRERRMWAFAGVYLTSGGLVGIFAATYPAVLGSGNTAEVGWIPALALVVSAFAAKWWGDLAHRSGRGALVAAALVTAAPFAAAALAFAGDTVTLGATTVVVLLSAQSLLLQCGSAGTVALGPALLLDDRRAQEENAVANAARAAGMAGLGFLATGLLSPRWLELSVARPAVLGLAAGLVLVVLSAVVPILHGTPRRGLRGKRWRAILARGRKPVTYTALSLAAGALLIRLDLRLAAAVLIVVVLVEIARRRLIRLSDKTTARLLRRVVPFAIGLTAAGGSYSLLYAIQVTPRALARQVGLPEDALSELLPIAIAAYAGWLALPSLAQIDRRFQHWLTAERSSRLRSLCLVVGAGGVLAIPLAPSAPFLFLAVVVAGLVGIGGMILKCEVAGAAESHDHLNSAVVAALVGFLIAVVGYPGVAGWLADEDRARVAGVDGHAWVFIGLGGLLLLAWRLTPPLLRLGDTVVKPELGPGLRDRRLWRAIALTTFSFAALGPIDAGLVFMIEDHGHQNAEKWAGLSLMTTLPALLLILGMERMMRRRLRMVAVAGALLGLSAALVGLGISDWSGVAWGKAFGAVYAVFEPSTTMLFLVAEWIALRDPANWERSALVTSIRLGGRALAAFAFTIGGEILGWKVSILLGAIALALALPSWAKHKVPMFRFGRWRGARDRAPWPGYSARRARGEATGRARNGPD